MRYTVQLSESAYLAARDDIARRWSWPTTHTTDSSSILAACTHLALGSIAGRITPEG